MDVNCKNKIRFYLPDFYYKYNLNIALIKMMHETPEYFKENIEIGAVYGSFPGAIWNGGRVMRGITDIDNIEQTIKDFNDLGVPVRFTFTNCLIEEKHVYDTYCNLIMDKANNGMNEVLINSRCLEEYLRDKYPNFKYIQSTTKCERSLDAINDACKKYDLVVPDYRDNVNKEFLESLEDKDKIELLINPYCNPECKCREDHYMRLSKQQIGFKNMFSEPCPDEQRGFLEVLKMYPTVFKTEDISTLIEMGFKHFKIEGRTNHNVDVIESYVYYMVKPEYKDEVRCKLTKIVWN